MTTLRMPDRLRDAADARAQEAGLSRSELIIRAVEYLLEHTAKANTADDPEERLI